MWNVRSAIAGNLDCRAAILPPLVPPRQTRRLGAIPKVHATNGELTMTTPGHLVLRIDEATPGHLVKRNCRDGSARHMDRSGRMVAGRSRAKVFADLPAAKEAAKTLLAARARQMAREYGEGASLREIGGRHGVSRQAVRNALDRVGHPRRPNAGPGTLALDVDAMRREHEAGATAKEIADRHGCGPKTVIRRLREAGAAIRKGGGVPPRG